MDSTSRAPWPPANSALKSPAIVTITCADGAVGDPVVQNDGWICDGANISAYLSAQATDFVVPPLGPVYGVSWAFTTEPVPAGTWPPSIHRFVRRQ